jgi:hypothetical protein
MSCKAAIRDFLKASVASGSFMETAWRLDDEQDIRFLELPVR